MSRLAESASMTFRSIRQFRNYRLWFIGQVISVSGTWVQNVAQAWFIVSLTHSAFALGLLAVAQFGPYFILGLFGGAVSDRLNKRHILIFTQSALAVSAGVLAVLALTGVATPLDVYLLATFNGIIQVLDTPARQAFTIDMVGRKQLSNAVALNSSIFNASRAVGPAIGGLLTAAVGVGACFAVNSVSFLAVLTALLLMDTRQLQNQEKSTTHRRLLRETVDGIAHAWKTPTIRLVTGMMLVIGTVSINFNVLLPVLAQRTLNSGPVTFQ